MSRPIGAIIQEIVETLPDRSCLECGASIKGEDIKRKYCLECSPKVMKRQVHNARHASPEAYEKHKERQREYFKNRYLSDPDFRARTMERTSKWRRDHPEKQSQYNKKYRLTKS